MGAGRILPLGPKPGFSPNLRPPCHGPFPQRACADAERRHRLAVPAGERRAGEDELAEQRSFRGELADAGLPFVMALKPRRGTWAYGPHAHTPVDAARALAWDGPDDPGDWQPVTRAFRDGHTETWWAADATLGWWGPDGARRLVAATADPATLPAKATWYLVTNLPRPGGPREAESPHPVAGLAEIVRIYGIRHWTEQGYKQVKDQLGWADFQVRSDIAIRRHQALVNAAFSFCWDAWFADRLQRDMAASRPQAGRGEGGRAPAYPRRHRPGPGRCAQSAPGFPPGSRCSTGGRHGPRRPRRCKP